jgi:ArsR family transcriptional regulator, arsenate/arsenite/antimonite-responsive transcriptional repressor
MFAGNHSSKVIDESLVSGWVPEATFIDCCSPLVRSSLTTAEAVELERLFKALGDRHRVRILNLLAAAGDAVCVCKLMPALGLAQPTVSYHLKLLVDVGLLERERRGRFSYYRIPDEALARVGDLLRGPVDGEEQAA